MTKIFIEKVLEEHVTFMNYWLKYRGSFELLRLNQTRSVSHDEIARNVGESLLYLFQADFPS